MEPQNSITLREGLSNFYANYDSQLSHTKEGISEEARSFFKSHDIAHVLFACDISLFGEGAVKVWTLFGTTLGFGDHIKGYNAASAYELSKDFSFSQVIKNIIRLLISIPLLIHRAKKMNKLWPWSEFEIYLDTPIDKIRKEFNINVLKKEG